MHTIGLETGCHVDCGLVHLKRRGEMEDKGKDGLMWSQIRQISKKSGKLCSPGLVCHLTLNRIEVFLTML